MKNTTQYRNTPYSIALLTALLISGLSPGLLPGLSSTAWAADPPSTGTPGGRADAGSRGCEETTTAPPDPTLLNTTTSTSPTFRFSLSKAKAYRAKFTFLDHRGNFLYQSNIDLPGNSDTVAINVPSSVKALAVGQKYQWFLKLYCQTNAPPATFIQGWIQPTHPDHTHPTTSQPPIPQTPPTQ